MRFAELLKAARTKAGLGRPALGKMAGCSEAFIVRLEAGDRFPSSPELVRRLARACGESPQLFTDALEFDRANRWLSKHPEHFTPNQLERIEKILFSEEIEEPVAA